MENKNITEQESLIIIQNMMNKTKEQLFDNSTLFLLWGFASLICAITQYILIKMQVLHSEAVWIAMPIIAVIHIYIIVKKRKEIKIETYNGNALSALWSAIGLAFVCIAFIAPINHIQNTLLPIIILLYAIGTFVTGKIIDFKPLIIGGFICFGLAVAIGFVHDENQLLVLVAAILAAYIIPGILLRNAFKNQN